MMNTLNRTIRWVVILGLAFSSPADLQARTLVSEGPVTEDSLADHQAKVFAVDGNVAILKSGESQWKALQKNDLIEEGDQVRTGADSYAEIAYDDYFLNFVRIEENSEMEFRSIEETDIYLSVGKLFNDLGGLVENSEYEVSTPTSVAAVRGTSFTREYDPDDLFDDTSVVEGLVNVVPVQDGRPDYTQSFAVAKDQNLRFDRETIQKRAFHQARPKPIPQQHKERIFNMKKNAQERLEHFAGGKAKFQKAHQHFRDFKKDPEQIQRIKHQLGPRSERPDKGPNQQPGHRPNQPHKQNQFGPKHRDKPEQANPANRPKQMNKARQMNKPKQMHKPKQMNTMNKPRQMQQHSNQPGQPGKPGQKNAGPKAAPPRPPGKQR